VAGNLYKDSGTSAYSWEQFTGDLTGAVASGNPVTISWSQSWLNTAATNPEVQFIWGNGNESFGNAGVVISTNPIANVPEPATPGLLGVGVAMAALGFVRRGKQVSVSRAAQP
jgi:hypothetical protein